MGEGSKVYKVRRALAAAHLPVCRILLMESHDVPCHSGHACLQVETIGKEGLGCKGKAPGVLQQLATGTCVLVLLHTALLLWLSLPALQAC
jgi:hypothetical protein